MNKKNLFCLSLSAAAVLLTASCATSNESASADTGENTSANKPVGKKIAKQAVKMAVRRSPVAVLKAIK